MWRVDLQVRHGFLMDDAFISMRYARNLAEGHGLVFNPGERVEGYTNFLQTLVMSVAFLIHVDPVAFVIAFGWLAGVVLLVATGDVVERLAGPWASAAVVLVLALDSHLAWWCGSGLETVLVSALAMAALCAFDRRRLRLSSVLYALTALTRMETVLLFGVALVFLVTRTRRPRRLAQFSIPFSAIFGIYFLARFAYYGWLFPNTFYAKVGTGRAIWARGLAYLGEWMHTWTLAPAVGLVAVALLVAVVLRVLPIRTFSIAPRSGLGPLVATSFAVYALYVVSVGGDHFAERFVMHFLPLFFASIAWALRAALDAFPRVRTVLFVALVWGFVGTGPSFPPGGGLAGWMTLGRYLRASSKDAPRKPVLATTAAGAIPFESGLPTIDLLGLTDEHIAHRPVALGHGLAGHEKEDPEYVLERAPDMISTWIDPDGYPQSFFRRYWRFWLDYELTHTVQMDERLDFSFDRVKVIAPGTPLEDIVNARSHGGYSWGVWSRRKTPAPPRPFSGYDFFTSVKGANEFPDAIVKVRAGHAPGHVLSGPDLHLLPGDYNLAFDLEVGKVIASPGAPAEICLWDVDAHGTVAAGNLLVRDWENQTRTLETRFTISADASRALVYIRFWCNGIADFTIRKGALAATE